MCFINNQNSFSKDISINGDVNISTRSTLTSSLPALASTSKPAKIRKFKLSIAKPSASQTGLPLLPLTVQFSEDFEPNNFM
jgi:hypothetical protein